MATPGHDILRRDIAILSTLAHLQCATVHQLHALCFPFHTLATTRITLRYLAEAHFIAHSRWIYKPAYHGQVWILTTKGNQLLQSYADAVPPLAYIDLQRPGTALEQEVWRVRHLIRCLVVGLLLEARQFPLFHTITVQLPQPSGWLISGSQPWKPEPDACLSIVWRPAERKAADWLPWIDRSDTVNHTTNYAIYVDRSHSHIDLPGFVTLLPQAQPHRQVIPMFVLADESRCMSLQQCAGTLPHRPRLRMAPWSAHDGNASLISWMDATGTSCGLQPHSDEGVA